MEKVFDYEKALERFMGEKEILLDVLPPYLDALKKHVGDLKSLDANTDCQKIRDIAHSIKGSSLNLEINVLGKLAEELEGAAYNNKSKEVSELTPKLYQLADDVISEVGKYL